MPSEDWGIMNANHTLFVGSVKSVKNFINEFDKEGRVMNGEYIEVYFDDLPIVDGEFVFMTDDGKVLVISKDTIKFINKLYKVFSMAIMGFDEKIKVLIPLKDNIVFFVFSASVIETDKSDVMLMCAPIVYETEDETERYKFAVINRDNNMSFVLREWFKGVIGDDEGEGKGE